MGRMGRIGLPYKYGGGKVKKRVACDKRLCDICGVKESGPSKAARKRKRKT